MENEINREILAPLKQVLARQKKNTTIKEK